MNDRRVVFANPPIFKIRQQAGIEPLVGFDESGVRLGMGGGFYDRSFRFLGSRSKWWRPKLVGIGFEFQYFETIEPRDWDIGLSYAVTETETRSF